MAFDNSIHYFSEKDTVPKKIDLKLLGIRGRQANEFAQLGLPILPGFIIDSRAASALEKEAVFKNIKNRLVKCQDIVGKEFGNTLDPLLVKIVISPNLAITHYPTLHNFGLAKNTIQGFEKWVGETFAAHEVYFLLRGILTIENQIAELEEDKDRIKILEKALKEIGEVLDSAKVILSGLKIMEKYEPILPEGFFSSAETQLEISIKRVSKLLYLDEQNDDDTAILIQPMVYGNYGKGSGSGSYYSRNIVTGEKKLQGKFFEEKFNDINASGKDINQIEAGYLKKLQEIGWKLEDDSKDIRQVRFTIEKGKLWIIDQKSVESKSTISLIKLLLDLNSRKIIDDSYVINAVQPGLLNEILHPILDLTSVKSFKNSTGGIAGAPGAAVGRVYFTADSLIDAQRAARQQGTDTRCVLVMPATYAGDVKAIEVCTGVISNEGGYSAHASVVARQYGKTSLVRPDMVIRGKKAILDGVTINEGDYVSISVPYYGESTVFFGKADLIEPDPETSGLLDFIALSKSFVQDFHVRANADSARDAQLALDFGADGIGLCRTEHMFFNEKRIQIFRELVLTTDAKERQKVLKKLQKMQADDFYSIFKVMDGREVTIRLLDAPLHEFLPHNSAEVDEFFKYLGTSKERKLTKAQLIEQIEGLSEINPMLGHRGCRIAISFPDIYEMQIRAIFEASYKLQKEKITVKPEIMIPLVMNHRELKQIVHGKKIEGHTYLGISAIEESVRKENAGKEIEYKVGTMIELPAAALSSDSIARYAQFFSFGTNDLTQTSLGLSRDDFNSFMPDYTMFDLIDGNPFAILDPRVKELIEISVKRGTMARPDLMKGLCGEHGARSENIRFCMDAGLNYVSCSSFSVPIALLSIAQIEIEKAEKEGKKPVQKQVKRTVPVAKPAPKAATKKPATKPAVKKPAAKPATKPATKKEAVAKSAAKKTVATKKPATKPAAKPVAKKPAAKPAATKKPTSTKKK